MSHQTVNFTIIFVVFPTFFLLIAGLIFFPRYTGLSRGSSVLAAIGSTIAAAVTMLYRFRQVESFGHRDRAVDFTISAVAAGLAIVLMTAFALRLWGRWVGDRATPEERLTGRDGVRAWFSPSNVVIGLGVIVCTWLGFDVSPVLTVVVVVGALVAAPLLKMQSPATLPAPARDDLSPEREKIVSMLEAGKLTPDESAELLQALSETSRAQAQAPVTLTPGQRLMLIGAALVTLGFFLPWFVINPGKEAGRVLNQMKFTVESNFPLAGGDLSIPSGQLTTPNLSITGGDIQKGLGWMALLLAGAAALLPYVGMRLDERTLRTIRILCLGLGSLIILYLLTDNIRYVGVGLVIAVGGYILEIIGVVRESRIVTTNA